VDRRTFFSKLVPARSGDGFLFEYGEEEREDGNAAISLSRERCFSHQNSICFSCREVCPEHAIEFTGMFNPEIIEDLCTGCALCVSVCPADALASGKADPLLPKREARLIGLDDLL
jgi:ferredoxin